MCLSSCHHCSGIRRHCVCEIRKRQPIRCNRQKQPRRGWPGSSRRSLAAVAADQLIRKPYRAPARAAVSPGIVFANRARANTVASLRDTLRLRRKNLVITDIVLLHATVSFTRSSQFRVRQSRRRFGRVALQGHASYFQSGDRLLGFNRQNAPVLVSSLRQIWLVRRAHAIWIAKDCLTFATSPKSRTTR